MNLHVDTTKEALNELIATADKSAHVHNIAIDFDGEVIIDPEIHFPHVDINRYKFCTNVQDEILRKDEVVQVLHEALMTVFETQHKSLGDYMYDLNIAA